VSIKETRTTHVVPRNGEWAVKKEGSARSVGLYETQAKAIEAARNIVQRSSAGQVVVHGVNGSIRIQESHGLPCIQSPPKKSKLGKKIIERAVSTVLRERLSDD
jgi:hypothetical protein